MTIKTRHVLFTTLTLITSTMISVSPPTWAAGGCGSVCLPLEALDPEKTQLRKNTLRVGTNYERASFNNFREGSNDITNPGGNKAVITQASFFADYGVSEKFTASLLVPYVKKDQKTNKFNNRVAMPIYEDWNGRRETNVRQVAPDVTTMFTLTYNIGRIF